MRKRDRRGAISLKVARRSGRQTKTALSRRAGMEMIRAHGIRDLLNRRSLYRPCDTKDGRRVWRLAKGSVRRRWYGHWVEVSPSSWLHGFVWHTIFRKGRRTRHTASSAESPNELTVELWNMLIKRPTTIVPISSAKQYQHSESASPFPPTVHR